MGIDKVGGIERRAACLTLVAVGTVTAAMGACAYHIAVSEKLTGLLVVGLHGCFLHKFPLVIEVAEKLARSVTVYVGCGT